MYGLPDISYRDDHHGDLNMHNQDIDQRATLTLTEGLAAAEPPALDPSRRRMLAAMGALAALGAMPLMAGASADEHTAHGAMAGNTPRAALIAAASHCVTVGQACLAHILRIFKSGDTALAECGILVDSTIAACQATAKLALNDSTQAKAMAAVCLQECEDCAKECRKHAKQHAICEEMAKSCEGTVAAARKFIG